MKPSAEHFEKLALEQMDVLYRVACRLTRDPERAGDLLQETYLRALRGREGFDLQAHGIRPWLIRIMHNLQINQAEHESRQPTTVEPESLETSSLAAAGDLLIGRDNLEQMDDRLVHALHELPSDYQVVMLLWAVEEFSYKEIAESLQIPIGTVMSRLHRARRRLADALRTVADSRGMIGE